MTRSLSLEIRGDLASEGLDRASIPARDTTWHIWNSRYICKGSLSSQTLSESMDNMGRCRRANNWAY